jgi:PPOX class probable F420-dependent enzyme
MHDDVRKILEGKHIAVLSTLLKDGSPKTAAVWYGFDGDDILVSTVTGMPKVRNVQRDGRVSLLVDKRDQPVHGVEVRGRATVEKDEGSVRTKAIVARYLGEVPDAYGKRLESEDRSIIRIKPAKYRLWDYSVDRNVRHFQA